MNLNTWNLVQEAYLRMVSEARAVGIDTRGWSLEKGNRTQGVTHKVVEYTDDRFIEIRRVVVDLGSSFKSAADRLDLMRDTFGLLPRPVARGR